MGRKTVSLDDSDDFDTSSEAAEYRALELSWGVS